MLGEIAQGEVRRNLRGRGDIASGGRVVNRTVQKLADLGLVTYLPDLGWRLTYPAGYALAERMGLIEPPSVTDGSPGDLYDPPVIPEGRSARADELLAQENAGITDSWRED